LTSEVLPSACNVIDHNWQNTAFVCGTDVVRQYVKKIIIVSIESLPKWLQISVRDYSRFHICLKVAGKNIDIFLVLTARELKGRTFKNLFVIGSEKTNKEYKFLVAEQNPGIAKATGKKIDGRPVITVEGVIKFITS
jgi:hypothetical protein